VPRGGYRGRDRAPKKIAGAEAMEKNDGGSTMSVPFDVHRSRTDGSSQDVSLHLYTPLLAFATQPTQRS